MNRLGKIKIEWTQNFAYAIGLITTDGNLSKDGCHIDFTSKDKELVETFRKCLGINNKIGLKSRGGEKEKKYYRVQFGDGNFYDFLLSIGLKPVKSKNLDNLIIPDKYFSDFLRGCIDRDGNINIFKHPESIHPQLRVRLTSASPLFLEWVKVKVSDIIGTDGGWICSVNRALVLSYAKADAIRLLKFIYYPAVESCLERKKIVADLFMRA